MGTAKGDLNKPFRSSDQADIAFTSDTENLKYPANSGDISVENQRFGGSLHLESQVKHDGTGFTDTRSNLEALESSDKGAVETPNSNTGSLRDDNSFTGKSSTDGFKSENVASTPTVNIPNGDGGHSPVHVESTVIHHNKGIYDHKSSKPGDAANVESDLTDSQIETDSSTPVNEESGEIISANQVESTHSREPDSNDESVHDNAPVPVRVKGDEGRVDVGAGGGAGVGGLWPSEDEDMPSFDEWKARKLREQQQVRHQEALTTHNNGEKSDVKQSNKNRMNVAAASCGAKILQSNPESQSAHYVLTENRDQYMIQPCAAKKWFVVELCEPVKLMSVAIANLELFSSLPETFTLSVSDRHPTTNWEKLGTFQARQLRELQSFTVNEGPFSKYVKIEILTHYGHEHYCPLTLLRLHGVSVHEDDEASDVIDEQETPTFDVTATPGKLVEKVGQLKDKVINMVNGVLNGNAETQSGDANLQDAITSGNQTTDNSSSHDAAAADTMQPCTPDASTVPALNSSTNGTNSTLLKPDAPDPLIDGLLPPRSSKNRCFVRLIESPQIPLHELVRKCNFCQQKDTTVRSCTMDRYTLCGYIDFVTYVYKTSCVEVSLHAPSYVSTGGTGKNMGYISMNSDNHTPEVDTLLEKQDDVVVIGDDTIDEITDDTTGDSFVINFDVEAVNDDVASAEADDVAAEKQVLTDDDGASVKAAASASVVDNAPSNDGTATAAASCDAEHGATCTPEKVLDLSHVSVDDDLEMPRASTSADVEQNLAMLSPTPTDDEAQEMRADHQQSLTSDQSASDDAMQLPVGDKENQGTIGPNTAHVRPNGNTKADDEAAKHVTSDGESVKDVGSDGEAAEHAPSDGEATKHLTSDGAGMDQSEVAATESDTDHATDKDVHEDVVHASSDVIAGSIDDSDQNAKTTDGTAAAEVVNDVRNVSSDNAAASTIIQPDERAHDDAPAATMSGGDGDDTPVVQKLSSSGKETTYMKLKNRIKDLEDNLNLSSTYLEQLSKSYRKRTEDMYKSLNKTIQQLSEMSHTAEIQDRKQQERIRRLEEVVHVLNASVAGVDERIEAAHEQMIERHMCLMLVEFSVFIVAMWWCLARQRNHYTSRIRTVSESYFNATTTSAMTAAASATPTSKGHRRGTSMDLQLSASKKSDVITVGTADDALKKSGSENDITIIEPNRRLFLLPTPNYKAAQSAPKKKKKRKSSHQTGASSQQMSSDQSHRQPQHQHHNHNRNCNASSDDVTVRSSYELRQTHQQQQAKTKQNTLYSDDTHARTAGAAVHASCNGDVRRHSDAVGRSVKHESLQPNGHYAANDVTRRASHGVATGGGAHSYNEHAFANSTTTHGRQLRAAHGVNHGQQYSLQNKPSSRRKLDVDDTAVLKLNGFDHSNRTPAVASAALEANLF